MTKMTEGRAEVNKMNKSIQGEHALHTGVQTEVYTKGGSLAVRPFLEKLLGDTSFAI